MKNINRKLNSNNGVSILFALVLFLVATIVSLVIIVASTSSVKRESSFKETTQRNIELDSAAFLLKNVYSSSSCSYTYNNKNNVYKLNICTLAGDNNVNSPYLDVLKEVSTKVIENNTNSFIDNTAFSITNTIDSYTNTVNCSYSIYTNSDTSTYVVAFKLDNGSVMYCKFNLKVENNEVYWTYYQSSCKGGGQ